MNTSIRTMKKALAAVTLSAITMTAMSATAHAAGYENTLNTSWGRTEHSFKPSGIHAGKLDIRLTDQAADGSCVYVKAEVQVTLGPNYTRDIGKVCGKGESRTFSHTFNPVFGTKIRGVQVKMCKEDRLRDTCTSEYNGR